MKEKYSQSIKARFSAAAKTYDQDAAMQSHAAAGTMLLLDGMPNPGRILELGCGSGQLTRLLVRKFPEIKLDAVDISNSMLHAAWQNIPRPNPVNFRLGDVLTVALEPAYDLVVSSSALHWVTDLPAGIRRIYEHLAPGGIFAASIMLVDTLSELHECRRAVAPGKPVHARLPELEEITRYMVDAGLKEIEASDKKALSFYPSARRFLRDIHEQGLTGGAVSRSRVPLNRTELEALEHHYEDRYGLADGRVQATYHLGYFKAVK